MKKAWLKRILKNTDAKETDSHNCKLKIYSCAPSTYSREAEILGLTLSALVDKKDAEDLE